MFFFCLQGIHNRFKAKPPRRGQPLARDNLLQGTTCLSNIKKQQQLTTNDLGTRLLIAMFYRLAESNTFQKVHKAGKSALPIPLTMVSRVKIWSWQRHVYMYKAPVLTVRPPSEEKDIHDITFAK